MKFLSLILFKSENFLEQKYLSSSKVPRSPLLFLRDPGVNLVRFGLAFSKMDVNPCSENIISIVTPLLLLSWWEILCGNSNQNI